MSEGAQFGVYITLKLVAYAGWSALGLFVVRKAVSLMASLRFGLLRLGIGVVFGISIFVIGGMMHLAPPTHPFAVYIGVYAPVRIIEWLIVYALLRGNVVGEPSALKVRAVSWILGGVLISFLADLPVLLTYEGAAQFLPVGRFLC